MKLHYPRMFNLRPNTLAVCLVFLLFGGVSCQQAAAASPRITSSRVADGSLNLIWTGESYSYEVQTATSLAAPRWRPVLSTLRTNAVFPLSGQAAFFRVVGPKTNRNFMIATTNLTTGAEFTLALRPQTNTDLVFDNLSNTNGSGPVQVIFPGAELRKFEIAFDSLGGFTIVSTNGGPSICGGVMIAFPGPDPGQTTLRGYLTNGTDMVMFSSVSDSAPPGVGGTAVKDDSGGPGAGSVGDTGSEAFSAVWCAGAWAAQSLACVAAGNARTLGCVGFFPPQPRAGYGYISSKTGVTYDAAKGWVTGECTSHCITCCKHNTTGALTDCTQ